MEYLPDEILSKIFIELDVVTLLGVGLVSKRFLKCSLMPFDKKTQDILEELYSEFRKLPLYENKLTYWKRLLFHTHNDIKVATSCSVIGIYSDVDNLILKTNIVKALNNISLSSTSPISDENLILIQKITPQLSFLLEEEVDGTLNPDIIIYICHILRDYFFDISPDVIKGTTIPQSLIDILLKSYILICNPNETTEYEVARNIVTNALVLLRTITSVEHNIEEVLISNGLISMLSLYLYSRDDKLAGHVCGIISNISCDRADEVIKFGLVPKILGILTTTKCYFLKIEISWVLTSFLQSEMFFPYINAEFVKTLYTSLLCDDNVETLVKAIDLFIDVRKTIGESTTSKSLHEIMKIAVEKIEEFERHPNNDVISQAKLFIRYNSPLELF